MENEFDKIFDNFSENIFSPPESPRSLPQLPPFSPELFCRLPLAPITPVKNIPIPLPIPKKVHTVIAKPVRKSKVDGPYEFYSGNFTGILSTSVNLTAMLSRFKIAVQSGKINGIRYYDATTREQTTAGKTPTMKKKLTYSTKRKRIDFDHQISIFWKKGYHVKLFKTGKMIIPACGSKEGARRAFEVIAEICGTDVKDVQCNNANIRVLFSKEIPNDLLYTALKRMSYEPEKTKTNRIKCRLWWNSTYVSDSKCICVPNKCCDMKKRKRGFEHSDGKCIGSTVMFGKKSATIFGTQYEDQRKELCESVEKLVRSIV